MMNFRTIKNAIVTLLDDAADSRYVAIGHQRQSIASESVSGDNRLVIAYYAGGMFPKKSGRLNGPTQHETRFNIDMITASAATADLSVIRDPASTPAQVSAALAAMQEAAALADDSLDELVDIVYQILMSGLNLNLGLDKDIVSNRWIEDVTKGEPIPRGDLVTLTATMGLGVLTAEQVPGDELTEGYIYDTDINIDGDDVQQTGVEVDRS